MPSKDIQFSKIIRAWLKNWVCHVHLKFWRFLAGNPNLDAPRTLIFGTKRGGIERNRKDAKFWISQKWFEISTPNFHQLLTSLGTRFVPKIKVLGASKFGFPAKNLQNFRWAWQTQFLSHTLIILENWISFEGKQMLLPSFFDISNGLNFPKNLKSCTVQI